MGNIIKTIRLLAGMCLLAISVSAQNIDVKGTPWEGDEILKTPTYRVVAEDSIRSIQFEGLFYKGHTKQVFAFYATPGMLKGDRSIDKKLPGIVLVHGGGGRAFREWVLLWARRGYAAIAIDTRGNGANKEHIENGFEENGKDTPYFDVTLPLKEQWMYQAVGDVILSHSLLLSFPEVDKKRTALTGISWGGVLTSVATSLDHRFRAAVPVYGCGFLAESGRMKQQLDKLPVPERETWIKQYDPSVYLSRAKCPVLFLNGTNDVHFYLPSMVQSAAMVSKGQALIKYKLRHGHGHGWNNQEIGTFIDHYLCNGPALPRIKSCRLRDNMLSVKAVSPSHVHKVVLYYTTDTNEEQEKCEWHFVDAVSLGKEWRVELPQKVVRCFVNVTDSFGNQLSGGIQE